jgi:transposase-like protein
MQRFAAIAALRRRHSTHVIPFFAYPSEVRKVIYTTNAIESLNAKLRRSVRSRGHFPSDETAMKLIWLQLRDITQNWSMPPRECSEGAVRCIHVGVFRVAQDAASRRSGKTMTLRQLDIQLYGLYSSQ